MADVKKSRDKGAEIIRQRALEEMADSNHTNSRELEVLGKLLGLKDHPSIKYIGLQSSSTSKHHYIARLRHEMDPVEIREMFGNQGLTLGMYNTGRPFYNFPFSDRNYDEYYLVVLQPLDKAR